MNITAYFTMTADGYLPRAEDQDLPPPDKLVADSYRRAQKLGCLIVGRTTYESMEDGESPVPLVVVSKSLHRVREGVSLAASPARAVHLVKRKGFRGALVGGGARLYSSFLAAGLVDDLYVNIAPEIVGRGLRVEGPKRRAETLRLLHADRIEDGVMQLHYRRK